MIAVPAGNFWMGCAARGSCEPDEYPRRDVNLSAFRIDRTEVTQGAFNRCVQSGRCPQPICDWAPSVNFVYPVTCADWNDAKAYCDWAGKRLPTEAEGENAARGTDSRIYPWGDDAPNVRPSRAAPTTRSPRGGEDRASGVRPYGARDMAGNVWEWVSDWYGPYDPSDVSDPRGPLVGKYRVQRGGSWDTFADGVRAGFRLGAVVSDRHEHLGVRCVWSR